MISLSLLGYVQCYRRIYDIVFFIFLMMDLT